MPRFGRDWFGFLPVPALQLEEGNDFPVLGILESPQGGQKGSLTIAEQNRGFVLLVAKISQTQVIHQLERTRVFRSP